MAYFDCQIVQGGGGLILVVTCYPFYAGATITATDGETTLQATCPSSSPYTVEFKIPNSGSWTISGTASGQTGSITVVIPDSATLIPPIPTGSTVTPVNDIQIWLHCANIWNKNYTTITQVLADASTLQALIASNNAADYMARSTSWANSVTANSTAMTYISANNYCANKLLANSTWRNAICNSTYFESILNVKVPTMTSNTTPSGEAFSTSSYDSRYVAYKAFNADSTGWLPSSYTTSEKIGYRFSQSIKVYKITIKRISSAAYTPSCDIKGSNDGSTWSSSLGSFSGSKNANQTYSVIINPSTSYLRYAIEGTFGTAGADEGFKVQFYGRA